MKKRIYIIDNGWVLNPKDPLLKETAKELGKFLGKKFDVEVVKPTEIANAYAREVHPDVVFIPDALIVNGNIEAFTVKEVWPSTEIVLIASPENAQYFEDIKTGEYGEIEGFYDGAQVLYEITEMKTGVLELMGT
ncbi:MAG TPA: hypothetical protein VGE63_01530 [Candidatus Paceibacterota bacterium]